MLSWKAIQSEERPGEPYAFRTVLGWAVLGPVNVANSLSSQVLNQIIRYMRQAWWHSNEQELKESCVSWRPRGTEMDGKLSARSRRSLWSWHFVEKCHLLVAKQQTNGRSKIAVFKKQAITWRDVPHKYRPFMENIIDSGYATKLTEEEAAWRRGKRGACHTMVYSSANERQNSCCVWCSYYAGRSAIQYPIAPRFSPNQQPAGSSTEV